MAAKNAIVSWLLNFRICMFVKSAVKYKVALVAIGKVLNFFHRYGPGTIAIVRKLLAKAAKIKHANGIPIGSLEYYLCNLRHLKLNV